MDNRRKHKRNDYCSKVQCFSCSLNGEKIELNGPKEFDLVNVSLGGLGIITETIIQTGSLLTLNIKLEDKLYENVTAKVMWDIKNGEKYRYGLQISNMSGRLYSHISELDNSIETTV